MIQTDSLLRDIVTRRTLLAIATSDLAWRRCRARLAARGAAEPDFKAIRARIGGSLGVHALDTQTGRRIGYDDNSLFAMASTFKLPLAAAVLVQVDRGQLELDQAVPIHESDMVNYAPVTSTHVAQGSITLRELLAAIVEVSDNPAANLLLELIGGPQGFTEFVRGLGDSVTRLDRFEPELNTNLSADLRDTTTARAMVDDMARFLTGPVLSEASRALLIGWLVSSRTGLARIRAGLPSDWKAGDKSGGGANGAINDVAIAWPPGRKPILIAIYLSGSSHTPDSLSAAHAEIATAIAREMMG